MALAKRDSNDSIIFSDFGYGDEDFESEGTPTATRGDDGSGVGIAGGGAHGGRARGEGALGDDLVVDEDSGGNAFRIVKTTDDDNFQVSAC